MPKIGGNFVTICYVFVGQTSAGDGCGNAPRKDQENQPAEYLAWTKSSKIILGYFIVSSPCHYLMSHAWEQCVAEPPSLLPAPAPGLSIMMAAPASGPSTDTSDKNPQICFAIYISVRYLIFFIREVKLF